VGNFPTRVEGFFPTCQLRQTLGQYGVPLTPWTGAGRTAPHRTACYGCGAVLRPGEKVGPCPVSVYPCSVCRQRKPGKLASAYWAWFDAEGGRHAWKLRLCPACAGEHLLKWLEALRRADGTSDVSACLSCGSSTKMDSDPMYLTLYLPGKEPQEFALQLDAVCAAKLRIPIVDQAERLPDRGSLVRGPSPNTSAWDELGLSPDPV
jgi:hypothetical protein